MDFLTEPERKTPVTFKTDVVVVGGGPAGLGAAISAARNEAEVLLIERYGYLGGTATAGLCGNFQGVDRSIYGGIFEEVLNRLLKEKGAREGFMTPFDPEKLKNIAFEMVEEARVKLFLHSLAVDTIKEEDKIKGVIVESKSGRQAILGKIIIDASADADIAVKGGVPFMKGRRKDGRTHALTMIFYLGGVNTERVEKLKEEQPDVWPPIPYTGFFIGGEDLVRDAREKGTLDITHENLHWLSLPQTGNVLVNSIHIIGADPTKVENLTRAEIRARKQATSILDFLRKKIPGFERSYILATPICIGARESRRIIGEYILSEEDVHQGKSFEDAIAMGNFPIDIHGPGETHEFTRIDVLPYDIPYRCLLPKKVDSLLVAGRCISCDFEAQASLRNMPCCFATGQAAGTAAALAVKHGVPVKKLDIKILQKTLLKQGAKILKVVPKSVIEKYKAYEHFFST